MELYKNSLNCCDQQNKSYVFLQCYIWLFVYVLQHGRPVPVIVPKDANKPLEYITSSEARLAAGVQRGNNYVFPNTGRLLMKKIDSLNWLYFF